MKNYGIVIQARSKSKRLPNKVFRKIDKTNSMLDYLIIRLKNVFDKNKIIIAHPKSETKFQLFSKKHEINSFSGSENNVLKRYYVTAKKFKLDIIIRITSDCPLVDPKLIKKMLIYFKKKKFDYLSNTLPPKKSNWPDGSDIEIFNFRLLEKKISSNLNQEDKEHVTNFIWKNPKKFKLKIFASKKNLSEYKYSVDYIEDIKRNYKNFKEKK
jgi:spore coat polysaccharide biosynthesis protein SpsF